MPAPARRRRPAPGRLNLILPTLLLAASAAVGRARGQSAPGTSPVEAPAGYPDPRRAGLTAAIPECGVVTITSGRCGFQTLNAGLDRMKLHRPIVNVVDVLSAAAMTSVPQAYNGLRQVLQNTFVANPAKPSSYKKPPVVTVSVKPAAGGPAVSATGRLAPSRQNSVKSNQYNYRIQVKRGGGDRIGNFPLGKCQVVIHGPCTCPAPPLPPPPPPPPSPPAGATCAYSDTTCAEGSTCPGGTAVSAACADRSGSNENPCACTALQELAALSSEVQAEAPWNAREGNTYCTAGVVEDYDYDYEVALKVICATADGVQLPVSVNGYDSSFAGALPPSLGELGPSLTSLDLAINAITSVPTEIGALTGLQYLALGANALTSVPAEITALTGLVELYLQNNQLNGLPAEFRTWDGPSDQCLLENNNPGFSCANARYDTTCCTNSVPGCTSTCFGSPPG